MTDDKTFVIVGGGLTGAKAAATLREEGFGGRVVLVAEEDRLPYERPPLSKSYLAGESPFADAQVHDEAFYRDNDVELLRGTVATALDPGARTLSLSKGDALTYDRLLIATGAVPRRPPIDGADGPGVLTLRSVGDADAIKAAVSGGGRLVIIGAGWIGCEVAASARGLGAEVTVVEQAGTPLEAVLGPKLGAFFAELHREHGVRFHFGARLTEIVGQDGMVLAARTDDGEEHPAHDVLAAIGAAPRTGLAEAAGLEMADRAHGGGIAVDEQLRTSDPDIYAAGDVASFPHALFGTHLRVEHWANALNGGPAAARAMLGRDVTYDRVPYFFSDQYDLGMEYSGWAPAGSYDEVVIRGDAGKRQFISFWIKDGRVLAGMNVNVWDVTDPIQKLIRSKTQVNTEALADPHIPLESLVS